MQQRNGIIFLPLIIMVTAIFAYAVVGYTVYQASRPISTPPPEEIREPEVLGDSVSVSTPDGSPLVSSPLAESMNVNSVDTVNVSQAPEDIQNFNLNLPVTNVSPNINVSPPTNVNQVSNTNASFQCQGDTTGWYPNPDIYGDYTNDPKFIDPAPGLMLYREVRNCDTKELVNDANIALQKFPIVQPDQSCYLNYVCVNRFQQQCYSDGSFDTFYNEACYFDGEEPNPEPITTSTANQ